MDQDKNGSTQKLVGYVKRIKLCFKWAMSSVALLSIAKLLLPEVLVSYFELAKHDVEEK